MSSSPHKSSPSQESSGDREIAVFVAVAAISFGCSFALLFYIGFGLAVSIAVAAFLGLLIGSLAGAGLKEAELIEWALAKQRGSGSNGSRTARRGGGDGG